MPASAIPFVGAIVTFFAFFIVTVGGAAAWTALPRGRQPNAGLRSDHIL